MGSATKHRRQFMGQYPYCIFCGGVNRATSIEHCPPRALFRERKWPERFEFSSCESCNRGTSNDDHIVAMISRFNQISTNYAHHHEDVKLMAGVHNKNPGLFAKMMPTNVEARRANRELGVIPAPGQTHQDIAGVKVVPEIHHAVRVFAAKLSKGIFFLEIKKIFPAIGCLAMRWFTNAEIIRDGEHEIFEILKTTSGSVPILVRSRSELNDQFRYKFCVGEAETLFILDVRIGNAFRILILGCTEPGRLDSILSEHTHNQTLGAEFDILQP
jgi:hypothetical protein